MGVMSQLAIAIGLTTQLSLGASPVSHRWPQVQGNQEILVAERPVKPQGKQPTQDPRPKREKSCPRALDELTAWMLQDIPSYANRALQQSWSRLQRDQISTQEPKWLLNQIIVAGRPEYEPLPTSILSDPNTKLNPNIQQVFFTTLERNYWNSASPRASLSASYHWLFLVQEGQEWQLVQMVSRFGKGIDGKTALPPRDSTYGAIAQGIRVWLRDCQEGTLFSHPPTQDQKIER